MNHAELLSLQTRVTRYQGEDGRERAILLWDDYERLVRHADRLRSPKDVEDEPHRSGSRFVTMHDLEVFQRQIMATVTEAIAAFAAAMTQFNDAQDTAIVALQGDVENLNAQILALQNSPGALSAADQATLDAIQARGKTITDKLAALDSLTPPVVPPAT